MTRGRSRNGWVDFALHAAGSNPLFPGAPAIDMHVSISANLSKGYLNVNAQLSGDRFPNAEVILQDEGTNRRLLCSFETDGSADGGPLRLFGDTRKLMNAICKMFPVDEAGRFR